jgi:hypothetical protein
MIEQSSKNLSKFSGEPSLKIIKQKVSAGTTNGLEQTYII